MTTFCPVRQDDSTALAFEEQLLMTFYLSAQENTVCVFSDKLFPPSLALFFQISYFWSDNIFNIKKVSDNF